MNTYKYYKGKQTPNPRVQTQDPYWPFTVIIIHRVLPISEKL